MNRPLPRLALAAARLLGAAQPPGCYSAGSDGLASAYPNYDA